MLHPITHEFLSKAKEYDRLRQREVCQLRNKIKTSGSASPSRVQKGMDLLRMLLLHAGKRLREAKIALQRSGRRRLAQGKRAHALSGR